MPGLQRDQLPQPQIKNDGRQAGIVKVLQHLQKAHQAQGSQEVNQNNEDLIKKSAFADFLDFNLSSNFCIRKIQKTKIPRFNILTAGLLRRTESGGART